MQRHLACGGLQQHDVHGVVHALEQELSVVGDHFPFLGSTQGAHQRLEQVAAPLVSDQHAKWNLSRQEVVATSQRALQVEHRATSGLTCAL